MIKKTEQQKLESNIWKFYLYQILYSLMFYTPIIVLFYQNNGISLTQVMTLQSVSSITWILMEIPSGYFADIVGRKQSLLVTGVFAVLTVVTFGLGNNFYHFLVAVLLWALAGVFISGADSAFMYDTLRALGREHQYKKVWGNVIFCSAIGISIASVVGGLLGGLDLRYPFFAMLPFYLLLIPVALSFYEPARTKSLTSQNHLSNLAQSIKGSVFKNKKIRNIILYSAFVAGAVDISYWLSQPYLKLSGLDVVYFGLVFAAFNAVRAVSAKYSHVIEQKLGKNFSLVLLFFLTSLCYLLMGKVVFIFSFIFVLIFQFIDGFSSVVISDYIHTETDSRIRATVASVQSLISSMFYSLIAPIVGWLVDIYTLSQALIIIGIIVGIIGLILSMPFLKKSNDD